MGSAHTLKLNHFEGLLQCVKRWACDQCALTAGAEYLLTSVSLFRELLSSQRPTDVLIETRGATLAKTRLLMHSSAIKGHYLHN